MAQCGVWLDRFAKFIVRYGCKLYIPFVNDSVGALIELTRKPCALCWIVLGSLVLLLLIVGSVQEFSMDMLEYTDRSFALGDESYTEKWDAYTLAADFIDENSTSDDNETHLPQTQHVGTMELYFTHKVRPHSLFHKDTSVLIIDSV